MLEKIFSWSRKKGEEDELAPPGIPFGRYSDNNKSVEKVDRWNQADTLFKEQKYYESIAAFFDYLSDEAVENVVHHPKGNGGTFEFFQGSKVIRGFYNDRIFEAEVSLARMPLPSVPVMRKLLEMNFALYYTRYALHEDRLCMLFDSDIFTANPSKLYYGLKELATKADKQDDLLVQDFATLEPLDRGHVLELPEKEKEVKFRFFKKWISETLELVNSVDGDKYSGGIAYLLLALAYRIDYLIIPEGRLMLDLEKIVEIYFKKDDRLVNEKNQEMIDCFQKLLEKDETEFHPYLMRSRYTFSIVTPQNYKTIADAIYNANQNIAWYKENKLPKIAARISEYGLSYCQYSYSLPKPVTELYHIMMMANYPDFFEALGFREQLFHSATGQYNRDLIVQKIQGVQERWRGKYPELKFNTDKLKFDDEVSFNQTFTTEVEYLNLETK